MGITSSSGADNTCPGPVAVHAWTSESNYLLGPLPAAGASVSNLEALTDLPVAAGGSATINVVNNSTGLNVLSCTITAGGTFCQNTAAVSVLAGSYLMVRIVFDPPQPNRAYRVTYRY